MVKRRAAAAGLPPSTCCHTFRATGITAYRARAADRGARVAEDDEALRPDGGHRHRRRDRTYRHLNEDEEHSPEAAGVPFVSPATVCRWRSPGVAVGPGGDPGGAGQAAGALVRRVLDRCPHLLRVPGRPTLAGNLHAPVCAARLRLVAQPLYQPSVPRPMNPLLASPCIGLSRRCASTPNSKFTFPRSSTPRP